MTDSEFPESLVNIAQPADLIMVICQIDYAIFTAVERNIVVFRLLDCRSKDILKKACADVPDSFCIYCAGKIRSQAGTCFFVFL